MKILSFAVNQLTLLDKVTASTYGWLLALICNVFAFFAPEKYAFTVVFFAVFLDALFGTWVAIKTGSFILSKLGRATILKIISYGSALVLIYMVERMAHDGTFIGVRVAAAWAAACEFWSMSASILILWPDASFFKILRRHLRGEIAAKLGQEVDDILPEKKKAP